MTFREGSERSLGDLGGRLWRNLEVLELSGLNMDPNIIRQAVGSLLNLRALKLSDTKQITDDFFQQSDHLPPLPPLEEIIFENTLNVTSDGLCTYLTRPGVPSSPTLHLRQSPHVTLKTLSLENTGIHPSTLHQIVNLAPSLSSLSIIESVHISCPAGIPALSSTSLTTLHFEITDAASENTYANNRASYYAYLRSSYLSHHLPNLRELYVRDPDFPHTLTVPAARQTAFPNDFSPPTPQFLISPAQSPISTSSSQNPAEPRFSSNNPFANLPSPSTPTHQDLVIYTKSAGDDEGIFSAIVSREQERKSGSVSAPRPVSSYGLEADFQKGFGARRSVLVGNGVGGFLAVPDVLERRPSSSAGESNGDRYDLWQ